MHNYVVGQNLKVTLLNGQKTRYINFDNAASTPALTKVMQTVNEFAPYYSSVHRGSGFKSQYSTHKYEQARESILNFFGGNNEDHTLIFGLNTSEAINKLAWRLELTKDDIILTSMLEHHSNDLPWRSKATVLRIRSTSDGAIDMSHLDELINSHKSKIRLIAITGASNVTGHITDIHECARKAHSVNAEILVDGAQLAPHRPIDIKPLTDDDHIDYLAVSAHKMYAPFGSGALIARKELFNKGEPEYSGGGTIDFVTVNEVVWAPAPDRDEVGSPNVIGAVAFASALDELSSIGMDKIVAHEKELVIQAVSGLKEIPGVTLFGRTEVNALADRTGVISFVLDDINHALAAEILAAEYGIGVRSGCFCAHPYVMDLLHISGKQLKNVKRHKLSKQKKPIPGLIRMSFGLYNKASEVESALNAISTIAQGEYSDAYNFNEASGTFEAVNWPNFH